MGRVTKTELNQQTARVLARVARGEHLVVTDRGIPIAEIAPPRQSRWEELIDSGSITPATVRGRLDFEPIAVSWTSEEALDDLRADRA